jgi:predicted Rdx family selenoprotein
VTLRRSGGGVFDVRVEDRIVLSKHTLGRFPTDAEIVDAVT